MLNQFQRLGLMEWCLPVVDLMPTMIKLKVTSLIFLLELDVASSNDIDVTMLKLKINGEQLIIVGPNVPLFLIMIPSTKI
jgi:hypothetical protein